MIVLFDTDIIIDVALNREPFAINSSKIIDKAEQHFYNAFIAWHSISNFYYIVSSSSNNSETRSFIKDLLNFIKIAPTTTEDALFAVKSDVKDFEDAMQVAAAKSCNAEFIITRNVKHYKNSPIMVKSPSEFLREIDLLH